MKNQQRVREIIEQYGLSTDVWVRYTDLTSEIGELGKELLKSCDYGNQSVTATNDMAMELGDTLFSLICLAETLNIDLNTSLDAAIEKYRIRFAECGQIGS